MSDVFHTGSPDSALWEFKHGNGNFKRGDLVGLREIKRRASRHALIHRDSFAGHRPSSAMPGTPAETIPDTSTEMRFVHLENSLFSMHNRLTQTEERNAALNSKCQALANNMSRCYFVSSSASLFFIFTRADHLFLVELFNRSCPLSPNPRQGESLVPRW